MKTIAILVTLNAVLAIAAYADIVNFDSTKSGSGNSKWAVVVDGTLTLGGLHANIIFRNNVKGTHTAEDSRDVAIILDGSTITLPKQPVKGGVEGNPIIGIQFLKGDGTPITAPVDLGRCNTL